MPVDLFRVHAEPFPVHVDPTAVHVDIPTVQADAPVFTVVPQAFTPTLWRLLARLAYVRQSTPDLPESTLNNPTERTAA